MLHETSSEDVSVNHARTENPQMNPFHELHETQSGDVSGIPVNHVRSENPSMNPSQSHEHQNYLKRFCVTSDGPLHEQPWAKSNMQNFHQSL